MDYEKPAVVDYGSIADQTFGAAPGKGGKGKGPPDGLGPLFSF